MFLDLSNTYKVHCFAPLCWLHPVQLPIKAYFKLSRAKRVDSLINLQFGHVTLIHFLFSTVYAVCVCGVCVFGGLRYVVSL